MTFTELIEAVGTLLRDYSTAPLADLEVHEWDQPGYEDDDGFVVVMFDDWVAVSQGIGATTEAGYRQVRDMTLKLRAIIPATGTSAAEILANRRKIESVAEQLYSVLRLNYQLTAGGQQVQRITEIRGRFGWAGDEDDPGTHRGCEVWATFRTPSSAAT